MVLLLVKADPYGRGSGEVSYLYRSLRASSETWSRALSLGLPSLGEEWSRALRVLLN